MTEQQARSLVGMLVSAFRPRDFGRGSEELYVDALLDLDFDEASRAVQWGIREGWRFLPSIAQMRDEIADDYFAPRIDTLDRAKLPGYRPPMLPGDVNPEVAQVVKLITDERKAELDERHIPYDPEQVRLRKAEAKAAAAKERKRLAAEKRKSAS